VALYKRERSTRLLVIGLVLTSLITITLDFRGGDSGPLAVVGRLSLSVISPIQEGISKAARPIGSFFRDLGRLGSLKEENARLESQLEESRGQQSQFQELTAEVKELRQLLSLREQLGFETIGASVVSEIPSNFEAAVTIDRGSSDGIEVDMPVIAGSGLVGRVSRVTSSWSKVLLIIDPNSAVGARLAASREAGILTGQQERDLQLSLVDQETVVEPGEQVTTSGLGGIFPKGIPIGAVSRVAPTEGGLEKPIFVRPNVDFSRLSEVLVVLSTSPTAEPEN
jgi:rod shape-determining protein MreC